MKTIDKIKHEAYILFGERGYGETSMRVIAGKVGIKVASIYSHYKSKEELFLDIFKSCINEYSIVVSKERDLLKIPLEDKMLYLLKKEVSFLEKNPHILKFLARFMFFPPVELKDKLESVVKNVKDSSNIKGYREIYNDLKANGLIKDSVTLDQFVSTFDICIFRYFVGSLGLSFYEETQSIEHIFNLHWKEIQNKD